ncbi:MAG: hypothetical protein GY705_06135, partial [Bacteroidetes bacterium]|nr:hypothetical protein [Bacteroidota bacterium]
MRLITIFKKFTTPIGNRSLEEIIKAIQSDIYKAPVERIRQARKEGNKNLAD